MDLLGRLLLVGSDPALGKQIKYHLRSRHYRVVMTKSPAKALALLLRQPVDIMIADLDTPGMKSLELIELAKGVQPDLQCILITGQGDLQTAIKAIQHGVLNYMEKPVNLAELDLTIRHGMEKKWLQEETREKLAEWETRMTGLHQEIVLQKQRAEERLKSETTWLEGKKLKSLGRMAGGIAHEFNNLLTCIIGFTELASMKIPLASSCQQHLQQVLRAGRRAARLTKQMLDYSGKGKMLVTPVDLSQIVAGMRERLAALLPQGITLQLNLAGEMPPIESDINQLHQAIVNLVTNAAESFTGAQGTVTLETGSVPNSSRPGKGKHPAPEPCVYLKITDSGCGMSEETKEKIFEPFFSTKFLGRGLGMAATLGIVRGHEGTITIDSAPNQGTTVTVFFPCHSRGQEQPQALAAPPLQVDSGKMAMIKQEKKQPRRGHFPGPPSRPLPPASSSPD